MQRPSLRTGSEEFFVNEISEEMFYLKLYEFVRRRHACLCPSEWALTCMADGNQQKHL